MTVTIQKELAERITARPGSKDYGALSIWVQAQCRVEILRILPPEAFWPRPKVSSAFLQITLDEALRRRIPDRKFFHEFVRAMFCHRRKFLRSELLTVVKGRLGKPEVDAILAQLNLPAPSGPSSSTSSRCWRCATPCERLWWLNRVGWHGWLVQCFPHCWTSQQWHPDHN